MAKLPVAIGLLACDQVVVEETSRNVTPVNCFTYKRFRNFPTEPTTFVVLAFLTDGLGEVDLEVVLQSLDNMEELHRAHGKVVFKESLAEYRCSLRFRDVSFPHEGAYELLLLANRELVAARRIQVQRKVAK